MAFLVGWTMILVYVLGAASVVRGLSTYVDALCNNAMRKAFESAAPMDIEHLSPYPDFFAFGVTLVFSGDKRILSTRDVDSINLILVAHFFLSTNSFEIDRIAYLSCNT